jgi:DNA-binding response OmpR family regulator
MAVKRILVVDDEQPIRELLQDAIAEAGWEVDTAADSAQALALVKANLFDAVVLDFVLPDMNGIQLHSEIRRLDAELARRTLFISGVNQPDERLRYYDGAGGFMPKPFDVAHLVAELERMLEG